MTLRLEDWTGKLIVSCQAHAGEPLHGSEMMTRMAVAAAQGGAVAIRANSPGDIQKIKEAVSLPVIGIYKEEPAVHEVFITPTLTMALQLAEAGADVIALDGTSRKNHDGKYVRTLIPEIKRLTGKLVMADIALLEEAGECLNLGADIISTTLSGYTRTTTAMESPDYRLIRELRHAFPTIWINAEGRIRTKLQAVRALNCGASFVTIGSAITRPQMITKEITEYMKDKGRKN